MKFTFLPAVAGALSLAAVAAHAATVVVDIPDPSPAPFIDYGTGDASVVYGGVTFSQSAAIGDAVLFNVGPLFSGDPAVLSSQGASSGVDNILITLPVFTTSLSINYGTFNGSQVTFLLGNGASFTFGSTGSGYLTPDGIGFGSSAAFNTLLITSSDAVLNINHLTYDSSAPEPATWAMLLVGFGLVGASVRRRQTLAA